FGFRGTTIPSSPLCADLRFNGVGIIAHTSRLYSNGQHAKLGFRCEVSSFRGRPAIVPSSAGARSSQSGLAAWPEGLRSPPAELHSHSSRSPAVPERALRLRGAAIGQ